MNTVITPTWVTTDTAMAWASHVRLVGRFSREYGKTWKDLPDGAKVGDTVAVRLPERWVVNEGQALQQQAIFNQTVNVSITTQIQVAHGWSSSEKALEIEKVQERYTKPAGRAMAAKCDKFAGEQVYKSVYFTMGTPGAAITDNETWHNGIALLRSVGVPEGLVSVLDPKTQAKLIANNEGLFHPGGAIGKMWKSGVFDSSGAFGIDEFAWDPLMPTHTTGTFTASTPVVSSALQTGSTLALSGLGTYAFKKGDTFTVDGVNAVHPYGYSDVDELQEFVITADVSGSSTVTLNIAPSIITSGKLQTVTASPANNAAVTFKGATGTVGATLSATTSRQSLIFHPAAFAWVTADLPVNLPGAESGRISDDDAKVSFRYVDQYQIGTDQIPRRFDGLIGATCVLPYFAMRVWGG